MANCPGKKPESARATTGGYDARRGMTAGRSLAAPPPRGGGARRPSELQGCSELMPVEAAEPLGLWAERVCQDACGPPERFQAYSDHLVQLPLDMQGGQETRKLRDMCAWPDARQLQACSELIVAQAAAPAAGGDEAGGAPVPVVPRAATVDAELLSKPPPMPIPRSPSLAPAAPRTEGEGASATSAMVSDLRERLRRAELAIEERDRRIESLEAQLRAGAAPAAAAPAEAARSALAAVCASAAKLPPSSVSELIEHTEEALRVQRQRDDEDVEIEACVEAACRKSETLIRKIAGLGGVEEPEQQWIALMSAHEDCRDRLAQIESLVQRRVEQLPPGDSELKVCRAVRGLCVGVQRFSLRRWALADM